MKKIVVGIIALILVVLAVLFFIETSAVSRDATPIEFTVEKGETYLTIASKLKNENLIKSEFFYKIYVKFAKLDSLQAGVYSLSESMTVFDVISVLSQGNNYNPDVVIFTVPEGKHLEELAEIISLETNNSVNDLLKVWNDKEFIEEVINKYWFITDDIKKDGIRYALEGYLYPDTYELRNKDVGAKEIAYKMLNQMEFVLADYRLDIENSEYSVHELLTLASIIEHEAILDDDRKVIASVFYNRLANNMKLQSCATIGYAIDEWKLTYSNTDLSTDSPYNTYYYSGLPIGPGNMPGKKSIEAALYPEETNYFYFLANVCDENDNKTYFSETHDEHVAKKNKYLTCF